MSRFWEIVFCVPLLFRRRVCLSNLKHAPSQNCVQPLQQVILEDTKTVDPGQDCAQRKTDRVSALNLWNPGCPEYDFYGKK